MHSNSQKPFYLKNEGKENTKPNDHETMTEDSKTVPLPTKNQKKVTEIRTKIVKMFSRFHLKFKLEIQSLILAVHLFDGCWQSLQEESVKKVALACFMLAIKYEERYPPSLQKIASYMQVSMLYDDYTKLEASIVKKFDYSISMEYPTKILAKKIKNYEQERKEGFYLFLELALLNEAIVVENSWETIVEAIVYTDSPYNERLNGKVKDAERVSKISKMLIVQVSKLKKEDFLYVKHFKRRR